MGATIDIFLLEDLQCWFLITQARVQTWTTNIPFGAKYELPGNAGTPKAETSIAEWYVYTLQHLKIC